MSIIATVPPYAKHLGEITGHPLINGLRLNTVMPIGESKYQVLEKLLDNSNNKKVWIDLKTRQLRITKFAYLPYSYVEISHKISVNLPAKIYFKDCISEVVRIVDGNKLILAERPYRVVGSGEPVNILDASLKIEGFLTESDKEYIEAFKQLGQHSYMLSFFENSTDADELLAMDNDAEIIAKIESRQGMRFVENDFSESSDIQLMAARDDLFINLGFSSIHTALESIIDKDKNAVAASKILTSLEESAQVSLQDISDLKWLLSAGYSSFMLSDGLCFRQESFRNAMDVLTKLFA
jgi:pyruvate kinase